MARRGFLTLGDCGNPAMTMCSTCSRPMCTVHLSPTSGFSQCLDCAATTTAPAETDEPYDDVWARRYRNDYYSTSGYVPFYAGAHMSDSYYDSQDVRSFDADVNDRGDFVDDESETGGFEAS